MKLVLEAIETGVAASPQVIRHSKRMAARNFGGATFTAALRQKDAAYAVALAESLLSADPIMGRAAVLSYDRAKAYAPDDGRRQDDRDRLEAEIAAAKSSAAGFRAFSSEVDTGSREENASKQESRASVLILSEPIML